MLAALIALTTGTVQQAPANKGADATFYRSEKRFGIATPEKGRNTCSWAFDGSCDDGGTGSEYSMCAPGTVRRPRELALLSCFRTPCRLQGSGGMHCALHRPLPPPCGAGQGRLRRQLVLSCPRWGLR